jgi:uncharacterized damage-inducible protein DinB
MLHDHYHVADDRPWPNWSLETSDRHLGRDHSSNRECLEMSAEPSGEAVPTRWTASTVYADMWVDPDDDPRDTGTELADERTTLIEYLRAYRLTLEMKCAGLDAAQMAARSVPPSDMSLLGLIRHMAEVERNWFRRVMAAEEAPHLFWSEPAGPNAWSGAVPQPDVVEEAWTAWRAEVANSERFVSQTSDLGVRGLNKDGRSLQLREVMVHMIEEYARHCGHADLLRERIDGRVGQ